MKKRNEVKNTEVMTKIVNDEVIESVDNKLNNRIVPTKVHFDGPLNWREIVRLQPEKEEILRAWFNETGYWPIASSIPVFDVTDGIIYPAYSLTASKDEGAIQVYYKVRNAVLNKIPVNWREQNYEFKTQTQNHLFIGCSDVDNLILYSALENYKKNKTKKEVLDKALSKLKELEQEILDLQSK